MLAVDLSFSTPTFAEAAGSTILTATLPALATETTTIEVAFGGTAKQNDDFQVSSTSIRIDVGQSSGTTILTALDDARVEENDLIEARIAAIQGFNDSWSGQPAYAYLIDDDAPLELTGTTRNDTLLVWLGNTNFTYRLNNGPNTTVDYAQYRSVKLVDSSNNDLDTVVVALPALGGNDVRLAVNRITIEGATPFDVIGAGIERQYINGSANDTATIEGTVDKDTYWGLPHYSVTTSGRLLNQVTGIRTVTMNGNGGQDVALLYGNGALSVDSYSASATQAVMTKTRGLTGDRSANFQNTANKFRYTYAYADDGNDTATLRDVTDKDDIVVATPTISYMLDRQGSAYQNSAYFFKNVLANSTGGIDAATLYDSAAADVVNANNMMSVLRYGTGGLVTANSFRSVSILSTMNTVRDIVGFTDSWAADIDLTSNLASERGRDDHLNVSGNVAELIYGNRSVQVIGFEQLSATANQGGIDTFTLNRNNFTTVNIAGFTNELSLDRELRTGLQLARAYLRNENRFNIQRYLSRGTDVLNPEFADIVGRIALEWSQQYPTLPALTASNLNQVASVPIYDYSRLEQVENSLRGLHRQSILQRLFDEVTRNASTNVQRHSALIQFIHKSVRHDPYIQPLTYNLQERARSGRFVGEGIGVLDPLVLLELAEGRCGQANRVLADLWHSLGFRVRVLNVNAHTSGEVFYEGQWHYNDAGAFGGADLPLVPVQTGSSTMKVPSFQELSTMPELIDRLPFYVGTYTGNRFPYASSTVYAAPQYFVDLGGTYQYYEKGAVADTKAQGSRDYGWNYVETSRIPWITSRGATLQNTQPSAPLINSVTLNPSSLTGSVTVGWEASYDNWRPRVDAQGKPVLSSTGRPIYDWGDPTIPNSSYSDVVGYRVYVSRTSRGWNYNKVNDFDSLAGSAIAYRASDAPWSLAMYDPRYADAPADVMTVWVPSTATRLGGPESVTLVLPQKGTYYITVMAVDSHGQMIGKGNYQKSEEIRVTL